MKGARHVAVLWALTTVAVPAATEARTPTVFAEIIHDTCGISAELVRAAMDEASRVYAAADIQLVWLSGNEAEAPADPMFLVQVVLLSDAGGFLPRGSALAGALGVAPPHMQRVYAFCTRIVRRAAGGSGSFTRILGRVLAHEIGHQLLPGAGHSADGLMRPSLDYGRSVPPTFTGAQAHVIRTRLVR